MVSDRILANAIRFLSIDAVQKANSGHPGMPMGMADIATVLWRGFLKHNPSHPQWINRDRFVLSNGHGSILHYACLHLTGYEVSIMDLKQFRQLHSKTPGHPEYAITPGVETTTGPLGQGMAQAIGMALSEKILAAQFNRPGCPIVDHYTYVFLGDGCLMEGISHEAASLAGSLGLGKLIAFWDNNEISIDGPVSGWFNDNTPKRFEAYGWHVVADIDGHDHKQLTQGITTAQSVTHQPSLLCCKTQIGFGSPNLAGTAKIHGMPLGPAEVLAVRQQLDWPHPAFFIPPEIYHYWDARATGAKSESAWQALFNAYQQTYPELATEFNRRIEGRLPPCWAESVHRLFQQAATQTTPISTRQASKQALDHYGSLLPELLGGSADLTESNATYHSTSRTLSQQNPSGNYLHYGVREFGMSAVMLGIALHGGFIPYGGTFLAFSDYARPALRLAALTKQRVIFVYTHDSIGVGEDGPTHQPIEQLSALRLIPNLMVWRPCDPVETAVAWQQAFQHQEGPSCLILSRQALIPQIHTEASFHSIAKGAYIISESQNEPQGVIIATGSEVGLAVAAAKCLQAQGQSIRVISMPAISRFAAQDPSYQESLLPITVKARVAIEAGSKDLWYRYVGSGGKVIGLDRYGESAPGQEVFKAMGVTVENIVNAMNELL